MSDSFLKVVAILIVRSPIRPISTSGGIMNIKVKKSVSVIERVILAAIAVLVATVIFSVSAHATTASVAVPAPVESPAPAMGPAAPAGNVVELPKYAWADCFNVYRNNVLIGDCVKPRIDPADGNYYFDDSSAEVTPASRWTYEISAVNATGESPRVNQGGPYPSTK